MRDSFDAFDWSNGKKKNFYIVIYRLVQAKMKSPPNSVVVGYMQDFYHLENNTIDV